jgi:YcxB-like protein
MVAGVRTFEPVFCVCFWLAYYGRALKIRQEMPDKRVTLRIEPESITFQTNERSTTLKWSAIKLLWSYPDVLFFFTYDREIYTAVPVAALGDDLSQFIEQKVREHGKEVA